MSILPSSIIIHLNGEKLPENYKVFNHTLLLDPTRCEELMGKQVLITYRVFPFDIGRSFSLLDTNRMITKDRIIYIGHDYLPYSDEKIALIDGQGLNYNGSFSRGFSVGNSQSLVLNSNFNLQLGGDLGDGLKVVAAISDDNIPIQPEGNTQLLQEFDKVFIQVSKDGTAVTAGDYELNSDNRNYFVQYQKKLKGLNVTTNQRVGSADLTSSGSFAVAKGKFRRQILTTKEGNQGPYKLNGNNGERFLIVESGSERVYLNGVLLTRGFEYDYVIDYNRAEISFTPSRLINQEARVVVEFEYKIQAYLRTMYALGGQYSTDKLSLNFNFFNEQDSKNLGSDLDLDSTDISILMNSGDDLSNAVRSGIRVISDPTEVLNRNLYVLVANLETPDPLDSFLVYTPILTDTSVLAFFSEVESGLGDYEIETGLSANGRIYKFVGKGQGKYLPQITLIPPEKKQMMSLGGNYQIHSTTQMGGEVAVSNFDVNRFSPLQDGDNIGLGVNFFVKNKFDLDTAGLWTIFSNLAFEQINTDFNAINPYRNPEFTRDWNINIPVKSTEQIYLVSTGVGHQNIGQMQYSFSKYDLKDYYHGNKHLINGNLNYWGFKARASTSILMTSGFDEETKFVRPRFDLEKNLEFFYNWKIGGLYNYEQNERRSLENTGDLLPSSFGNSEISSFVESPENDTYKLRLSYKIRNDSRPLGSVFESVTQAKEWQLNGLWAPSNSSNLDYTFTLRDLVIIKPDLVSTQPKKTILSQINYTFSALKNAIRSTTSYGVSSGQEPKLEYEFIAVVDQGTGSHIYLGDLNGDGIDQPEEYRIAEFADEANFIRISIYNNEFVLTNSQSLNQSLRLDFRRFLLSSDNQFGTWANLLSRFSTTSNFRFAQKTKEEAGGGGIVIFSFDPNDPNLVSYNSLINNTLFFNKGNPSYDLQLGQRSSQNRINQISGYNRASVNEYFSRIRINLLSRLDFILNGNSGNRSRDAEFYDLSDYSIDYIELSPEVNFRPQSNLRFILKYSYTERNQTINELESALSHTLGIESTYRKASTSSLDVGFSLVSVSYEGLAGSSVEYDLLEGLKNGRNFLWNAAYTRRLSNNVDLSLNYNGRKTGISDIVHIARAQIKATF